MSAEELEAYSRPSDPPVVTDDSPAGLPTHKGPEAAAGRFPVTTPGNQIEVDGYVAFVEYDEESRKFIGRVVNIRYIVTFCSRSKKNAAKGIPEISRRLPGIWSGAGRGAGRADVGGVARKG